MKLSKHLKQLALVVAGLLLSLSFATSAWSGPTATPPNVNELPPLNSSTMPQVKGNGTLANNVLLAISGTTVANRLFAWDNMSVVEDLTIGSLAGTGVRPVCVDTDHKLVICTPACGNSFIETGAGEQCDDGNTNNGDGCSSTCQNESAPVCGNNIIEGAEQCDDGNTDNGDGCSSVCQNESSGGYQCWTCLLNGVGPENNGYCMYDGIGSNNCLNNCVLPYTGPSQVPLSNCGGIADSARVGPSYPNICSEPYDTFYFDPTYSSGFQIGAHVYYDQAMQNPVGGSTISDGGGTNYELNGNVVGNSTGTSC